MIGALLGMWTNSPWLIHKVGEFFFMYIVVRGIVASDISNWLEDRGIVKKREQGLIYHILDFFYFRFKREESELLQTGASKQAIVRIMDRWTTIARKVAIVQHYHAGHIQGSITECNQGKCGSLFTSRA